jgi:LacI family transcriptional regulator
MVHKDPAKVRIKDLAQTLGLSMGTIDRALNNRPEISIATREKVLKTARRMGYHPDLVASVLSSKRRLRIAVNLPRGVTPFHEEVRVGIEEEHAALGKSLVNLEYFHFPGLGSGEMAALDRAMKSGMDGMIYRRHRCQGAAYTFDSAGSTHRVRGYRHPRSRYGGHRYN